MGYRYYNANPENKDTSDCVVRAISVLMDMSWSDVYVDLCMQGFAMRKVFTVNEVWGKYLQLNGFRRYIIPDTCPNCYTIKDFCNDHQSGKYLLATGSHVVAAVDGNYYDTWDSGDLVPVYYWKKE